MEKVSSGTNDTKMRKIEKVGQNGQFETPYDARITRIGDGPAGTKKYIITAERMEDVNWRDDDSLSFGKRGDNTLPNAKIEETQIVTKSDGTTWLIPPLGLGDARLLSATTGDVQKMIDDAITGAIGGSY